MTKAPGPRFRGGPSRLTSLRARLLGGVLALTTVALLAGDLVTWLRLGDYLEEHVTAQLMSVQTRLDQLDRGTSPPLLGVAESRVATEGVVGGYLIDVRDERGALVARQTNETRPLPPVPPMADLKAQNLLGRPFRLPMFDVAPELGYEVLVRPRWNGLGTTTVAIETSDVIHTGSRLLQSELITSLVVLFLLGLLAVTVVRIGLRPLDEVENTVKAIVDGADLSRRVPIIAGRRSEIGRLSQTLNTMLDKLQTAFEQRSDSESRLRRFVADASHELRTPTASIRGFAELHRHGVAQRPEQISERFARIEAEATRMGLLVEDLLLLAKIDQYRSPTFEPVELIPIAVDSVEAARAVAPNRPLRVEILPEYYDSYTPPPIVLGDEMQLRQVTANLLSNALSHTPAGTPVIVRVGADATRRVAMFEVIDRGPGLRARDADRVFERFYRADPARSRTQSTSAEREVFPGAGAGLGLSIVAAIVNAHHGHASHHPTPGGGATFLVTLPGDPCIPARPLAHQQPAMRVRPIRRTMWRIPTLPPRSVKR